MTALDRLSMSDWLDERGFTSPRLRWLVEYGCRDDYGATPDDVSAWAGLFYFASRRKSPGAEPQPLLTWPEGNGRLVAHLAAQGEAPAPARPRRRRRPADRAERGVEVTALSATGGSSAFAPSR